jgi:DNA repair protein RadA/Sms
MVAGAIRRPARPIAHIDAAEAAPQPTGVGELDRVLGGGLVPGSVVLLAGDPGVGKSTLLLQVAHRYAEGGKHTALIVTGEESASQVRLRAHRTGADHPGLFIAAENDLGALVSHVDQLQPGLLVVDSIQTLASGAVDNAAGSVVQVRAVTSALIAMAKALDIATLIVGHVTKDGSVSGPRVLEHLVDVVLHFEGERHSALRLIRATKNRYGPADEVGCFEMRDSGILELPDPSGLFLSDRTVAVPGSCVTITLEGRRPLVTEVQALVVRSSGGAPRRAVRNLDAGRVAMLLAVLARHAGLALTDREVYAATVGGISSTEPASDLAIALALAGAARETPLPATLAAIGEVSLSGDVRRVGGVERRLAEAARLGFTTTLVPHDAAPASAVVGMNVLPVATLAEALAVAASLGSQLQTPRRPALRAVPGG